MRNHAPANLLDQFHDLGNYLLMLVIIWSYVTFSKYFIIW